MSSVVYNMDCIEGMKQSSKKKIKDLKRGIERAKRQKRRELRGDTIII